MLPSPLLLSSLLPSPPRRPYSLAEWKQKRPNDYVEIKPTLQPDLGSAELQAKRANHERVKEFSRQLLAYNQKVLQQQRRLPRSSESSEIDRARDKADSKRERALQFAQNIPKPKPAAALVSAYGHGHGHGSGPGGGGGGGPASSDYSGQSGASAYGSAYPSASSSSAPSQGGVRRLAPAASKRSGGGGGGGEDDEDWGGKDSLDEDYMHAPFGPGKGGGGSNGGGGLGGMSEIEFRRLEALEQKHNDSQRQIAAIKRSLLM